jgi:hypothetical protein
MNENKKKIRIENILSQGLVKPQTARARIIEMFRTLGIRYIFWDMGYSLFFATLTLAIGFTLFIITPSEYRYAAAVTVAPLLFLLIIAFAETSERACGLYELKQTCRYTIRQITALRVVCYSVAGATFTAVVALISAENVYEFLSLFSLCLSALFVCAALSLSAIRLLRNKWISVAYSAAWIFVNVALTYSFGERWEAILGGVPMALSISIALIGATVLVYQISRMLSEVDKYAVA